MQKALLDLALPPTLTQHEAFKPKLGSQGQVGSPPSRTAATPAPGPSVLPCLRP